MRQRQFIGAEIAFGSRAKPRRHSFPMPRHLERSIELIEMQVGRSATFPAKKVGYFMPGCFGSGEILVAND